MAGPRMGDRPPARPASRSLLARAPRVRALLFLAALFAAEAAPLPAAHAESDDAKPVLGIELRPAAPIALYDERLGRADSNSPVHAYRDRSFAFVSHYEPIGHIYRRIGSAGLRFEAPMERVRIAGDPDPAVGKWLESTWRDATGRLYGWYHAEEVAPCLYDLRLPHVGAMASDDDGATWHPLGVILRAPADGHDCDYRNGFFAGGYGDPSVIADRESKYFYIHFSSYVSDESAQGIVAARYPVARRDQPAGAVEVWTGAGWVPAGAAAPRPFWPQERGWRHRDPTGFWGPAVHFNRALGRFVMLLNRTEHGAGNWRQEGIYITFNPDPADPSRWTGPQRLVEGGYWYPQVIGLGADDGDTRAGEVARFFMSGFSAWDIRFPRDAAGSPPVLPVRIVRDAAAATAAPALPGPTPCRRHAVC